MDSNTHSTSHPARTPAGTQAGFQALVADPDGAQAQAERQHQRRGLWLSPTWEGMVALQGLLDPEAGQTLLAALEPLARPHDAHDTRSRWPATRRCPDRTGPPHLESGRLPQSGGVRPQLLVTVDLDSLLGHRGGLGGETGGPWPLDPETCRRLACDAAVTRVLVSRHPTHQDPDGDDHLVAHDLRRRGAAWRAGSRRRRPGSPRPWVAPPPNRWRSAGPAGSSPPPNAPP